MKRVVSKMEKSCSSNRRISGMPTGYSDVDRMTAGFQPGELIIIASSPGMGKTAFAHNIVLNTIRNEPNNSVAIFSPAMCDEKLMERMMCTEARIPTKCMRTCNLNNNDWLRLPPAICALHDSRIFIDDASTDVDHICNTAWQLDCIDIMFIDSLQALCQQDETPEQHSLNLSNICYALKSLALAMYIPVVLLSGLNSANDKRYDKRPVLSDLTGIAGNAADIADLVLFVHLPAADCAQCQDRQSTCYDDHDRSAEIIIGKQNSGPTGTVTLHFERECGKFEELGLD